MFRCAIHSCKVLGRGLDAGMGALCHVSDPKQSNQMAQDLVKAKGEGLSYHNGDWILRRLGFTTGGVHDNHPQDWGTLWHPGIHGDENEMADVLEKTHGFQSPRKSMGINVAEAIHKYKTIPRGLKNCSVCFVGRDVGVTVAKAFPKS